MPVTDRLPHELTDLLMRNGMSAAIVRDAAGQPQLMVQGHDSPVLTYHLTSQQLQSLTGWGSAALNKRSYNTFAEIVASDFDLPKNYVHANNANTRVAMGLHGYRIGVGEYGREPMMSPRQAFMRGMPMGFGGPLGRQRGFWQVLTPFLGWTERQQDGFHLRRMGGMLVTPQGAPIVPERPDGRMRPGELQSGGYGFYWKGRMNETMYPDARVHGGEVDPLQALGAQQITVEQKPMAVVRSTEPAKPYKDFVTSPVYFTADKFKECLDSHGVLIDAEKKEVTIQSSRLDVDLTYSLSDEHIHALLSDSVKDVPVEKRLEILNEVLGSDFKDSLTMDMLNSMDRVSIDLKEEAKAELAQVDTLREQESAYPLEVSEMQTVLQSIKADGLVIPLISEKEGYHWEHDTRHGRDIVLGNVVAYENAGKYFLRADVNGEAFTKQLTAKEFQEIHYRNDERRVELIDKYLDGIHLARGDYKGEVVNTAITHGEDLQELSHDNKGWYREGKDGREVSVGDITVAKQGAKYVMTAEIDGQVITHDISQMDFNKFLQMDDFHRMKLFSKIFDEVDIKNSVGIGTKVGAAIMATLTVMGEMSAGAEPMVSMPRGDGMAFRNAHPYFKPGVDSPMDLAARNFEAAMVQDQMQHGIHH